MVILLFKKIIEVERKLNKMKKRILSVFLVATMCISMVACGSGDKGENKPSSSQEQTTEKTAGQTLLATFKDKAADSKVTSQEIADAILDNKIIEFAGASMPVEEGLLSGLGNAEIKGFKDGVQFGPMISTMPFIGYVFTLDASSDADAFVKTIKDNADPRWNICTEADEVIVEKVGDKVLLLMCKKSFEDEQ